MNRKIFFFFFLILISALFSTASAASISVTGYAWSDTIGWIQFNPTFGGVFLDDATGDLNGYAWSDNIGWVWFDATDGTHPSAKVDSYTSCSGTCTVSGWARAIAADGNGWDGWIKMSDTWTNGATLDKSGNPYNFNGFAWGSDVVGWISLSGAGYGVTIPPGIAPTVDLKVNSSDNPPSVPAPADLTVSWTTTNASQLSSCSGTGQGWTGPKSTLGGNDSGGNLDDIPAGTYTYSITCDKIAGGTISDSVTITVTSGVTPPNPPSGLSAAAGTGVDCEKINLSWADNSDNETKFEIERKTGVAGAYNKIGEVGANVTIYQDSTGVVGTTYYYRVRACNGAGCSGYSNESSAAPVACVGVEDFSLGGNNVPIWATIVENIDTNSTRTIIRVLPTGGFTDPVTLSISSPMLGFQYNFSDNILQYIPGTGYETTEFWVKVPGLTPKGLYTITIQGDGGGLARFTTVQLNVEHYDEGWDEF